jgi:L-asparaginase
MSMPSSARYILVLATGGTIAGTAASATAHTAYTAAQLGVADLLAAVPALAGLPLQARQVAQVDSKNMSHALWQTLVQVVGAALADEAVSGIVITHGTDTLEETAYLLQRVLAPAKPVVLTAAMRPATSLQADGPQNLLDAVTVARAPGARGVLAVVAGRVLAGDAVRKVDAYRLDAFDGGEAGPVALVQDGTVRPLRPWPSGVAMGADVLAGDPARWPRVGWVTSHAGFDGAWLDAALPHLDGLLIAGTGNGSLHAELHQAAARAAAAGVAVRLSTRCASGQVVGPAPSDFAVSEACSPAQARVALLLELLAARREAVRPP